FTIVYNSKFDEKLMEDGYINDDKGRYSNSNLFELYPTLNKETSSIVRSITKGEVVIKKFQRIVDFKGNTYCTHNITIPIVIKGKIMGAMELVKDVTTVDYINNEDSYEEENREFTSNTFLDSSKISFENFITRDLNMLKVIEQAKIAAKIQSPTLIYGESGTGKEVLVQAMINYSGISRKNVIIQNCAALPDNLIESILFGTYKGAYTGAENRKGLFEEADNGLIFLDELNSIPYDVQGKLLRVLQDGSFRPVGSNEEKHVNVKIIAAMNVEPLKAIEEKQLRSDLFYRLSGGMIYIPSLRDRKKDIKLFINHYIKEYNNIYEKNAKGISNELEKFFMEYNWGGNVRELKHIIESMIGVTDRKILDVQQLPAYLYNRVYKIKENDKVITNGEPVYNLEAYNLKNILKKKEIETIKKVLEITRGNKTKAGEILGIPRQTLKYKMDKFDIK
ncbi:MAG: sigma 54-interacting transcriptional regulator, partial [Sedimentibacter sp.]|uniref:sigma-54 interaction domain-containing protein n=1 Tax=Sedimentibacter sp. TaxID=1960295 RepID=UPI002981B0E9